MSVHAKRVDNKFIIKGCLFAANELRITKHKLQTADNVLSALTCILFCCLMSAATLFFAGCSAEQKVDNTHIDLYVDAVTLAERSEREKAIKKLNSAVQINESFTLAYSLLGEIYQEMQDYEKSAASYEKATELNPWSFNDHFNLGRVYQLMKKFTQAVRAYSRACELKPEHLEAHLNNAKCYYEIQDYQNALLYGERAERIDPNTAEVQKILGDVYGSQKDYELAISSYKRSLEIDSSNPAVMASLAVAYLNTNRNEPAKVLLETVLQIQPDSKTAYQYLGYCYLQLYSQAVELHKKASQTNTQEPELIASLKEKADKILDDATESYSRAIEINDKDWEALRGLGVAYMLKARRDKDNMLKEKALEQWQRSLEVNPQQPDRERLLKLIAYYSKQE